MASSRRRRVSVVITALIIIVSIIASVSPEIGRSFKYADSISDKPSANLTAGVEDSSLNQSSASSVLSDLAVKGRAPKTGYSRAEFGDGWAKTGGCETRDIILYRDLQNPIIEDGCNVVGGSLNDPYTGLTIQFNKNSPSDIQIDHVVALSNAWQTGAQYLDKEVRIKLANDPLELLAVQGKANQIKGDGDAATWLPSNKTFRCQYIARQIAVKYKYNLWVTASERGAMASILASCPNQMVPID